MLNTYQLLVPGVNFGSFERFEHLNYPRSIKIPFLKSSIFKINFPRPLDPVFDHFPRPLDPVFRTLYFCQLNYQLILFIEIVLGLNLAN